MKKLIIDMDDVMCRKGFIHMINQFLGTNYKQEDAKSYYVNDLIPPEKFEEWVHFFIKHNVYDYVEIMPKAKDVIKRLNQDYEIYITTAYVFRDSKKDSGNILKQKFDFLQKEFPFIKPEQYIFINNKDLIEADIRIDDRISNLRGKATIKLLFTAYHNKKISKEDLDKENIIRVNTWIEIEEILKNI